MSDMLHPVKLPPLHEKSTAPASRNVSGASASTALPLLVGAARAGPLHDGGPVRRGRVGDVQALATVTGDEPDVAAARVRDPPLLVRTRAAGRLDDRRAVGARRAAHGQALGAVPDDELDVAAAHVLGPEELVAAAVAGVLHRRRAVRLGGG